MAESIRNIMAKAYLNVLGNPREARFVAKMQRTIGRAERRRKAYLEKEGVAVPPFLIASIATTCNLQCKGCYARKNGIAGDTPTKETLTPDQWGTIFREAAELGISFCLLAGGEPLTQRAILEAAAATGDIIFPVFTNGTMIGAVYTDFFKHNLNLIPVISLEGERTATDERRGNGVFQRALLSMEMLHKEKLFFGTSITVTTDVWSVSARAPSSSPPYRRCAKPSRPAASRSASRSSPAPEPWVPSNPVIPMPPTSRTSKPLSIQ